MDHSLKHGAATAVSGTFVCVLIAALNWTAPRWSTFAVVAFSVWAAGSAASVVYWIAFSRKKRDLKYIWQSAIVCIAFGVAVGIAGLFVEWLIVSHYQQK